MTSTDELLLCPFCGGEATINKYFSKEAEEDRFSVFHDCSYTIDDDRVSISTIYYDTEAEAIAAWNSRTPIEYDGWFYLPKPKDGIVVYSKPEITRTENGYKVRQIADVVDEAARRWGEELGDYVMKRICEAWNTRHVETCEVECFDDGVDEGMDGEWFSYAPPTWYLSCGHTAEGTEKPNYCPNCGAKVVNHD